MRSGDRPPPECWGRRYPRRSIYGAAEPSTLITGPSSKLVQVGVIPSPLVEEHATPIDKPKEDPHFLSLEGANFVDNYFGEDCGGRVRQSDVTRRRDRSAPRAAHTHAFSAS